MEFVTKEVKLDFSVGGGFKLAIGFILGTWVISLIPIFIMMLIMALAILPALFAGGY